MIADSTNAARPSYVKLAPLALSVALIVAIAGLVYTAAARRQTDFANPAHAVITGKLRVSYMLVTSKSASTEESSGSTIDASRVQYFPGYVLVTTTNDATVLWAVDRLKMLEVTEIATDAFRPRNQSGS